MTIKFKEMVAGLKKDGQQIIDSLTPEKADLLHMAAGISGEAGELLDCIKKHVIYNKPLDRENAIEELGDIEAYLADRLQENGLESILEMLSELREGDGGDNYYRYSDGRFHTVDDDDFNDYLQEVHDDYEDCYGFDPEEPEEEENDTLDEDDIADDEFMDVILGSKTEVL